MAETLPPTISLVGAGLSNGLLAYLLRLRRPEWRVQIFEAEKQIPEGRTWSFHHSDVGSCLSDLQNLITHQWQGYEVRFAKRKRHFISGYGTLHPQRLQKVLTDQGVTFYFQSPVRRLSETSVELASGESIASNLVIDGRGYSHCSDSLMGYQKFVGLSLRCVQPHGLKHPILMDATVAQKDGYRFIYILPWSDTELLVEDTRYSDSTELCVDSLKLDILEYCARQGWRVGSVVKEESGVLPIPLNPPKAGSGVVPQIGMAGGFFHPVTGYSLPDAVRVADRISRLPELNPSSVRECLAHYAQERLSVGDFYRLLNRMMFLVAEPDQRVRVFEHFYKLSQPTIERFYAGSTTLGDRVRILSGKPPVPVWPALRLMMSRHQEVR